MWGIEKTNFSFLYVFRKHSMLTMRGAFNVDCSFHSEVKTRIETCPCRWQSILILCRPIFRQHHWVHTIITKTSPSRHRQQWQLGNLPEEHQSSIRHQSKLYEWTYRERQHESYLHSQRFHYFGSCPVFSRNRKWLRSSLRRNRQHLLSTEDRHLTSRPNSQIRDFHSCPLPRFSNLQKSSIIWSSSRQWASTLHLISELDLMEVLLQEVADKVFSVTYPFTRSRS